MNHGIGNRAPGILRWAAASGVAVAMLLAGTGPAAWADDETVTTIDPVQVTATRIPKKVSEQASSVSVVTREEIELGNQPLVGDAMQGLPGVEVRRKGTPGNQEDIKIRGGSGKNTLVLIDGFPVNSPTFGAFDIGSLPADAFERVEVMRGAQGALYGSSAMSGVVNFVPRKGDEGREGGGGISGGSYNSLKWNGYGQGGDADRNFHLGLSGFNSDGQFRNDDVRSVSFLGTGETTVGQRNRLHAIVLSTDTNKGIAIDGTQPLDINHLQDRRSFLAGLRWETQLSKVLSITAYGSQFDEFFHEKDPVDPGEVSPWGGPPFAFEETTKTRKQSGGLTGHLAAGPYSDTFLGAEYAKDRAGDSTFSNFGDSVKGDATINRSVYLQEELHFAKRAGLSAGARLDKNSEAGTQFNPKAAAYCNLDAIGTRLRAGVGRGFRTPGFMDKDVTFGGNPDLKPETTVSHEAGIDVRLPGRLGQLSATWFYQNFHGRFQTGPASAAHPFGQLENIGRSYARGIETSVALRPMKEIEATLGYTLTDSWDSTNQVRLQGIPRHRGTASLLLRPIDPWETRIDWQAESNMLDFGPADLVPTVRGGYARVDLSTRYTWTVANAAIREVALTGEVRDLTNRQFEERRNYPVTGTTFMVGTQIRM
ncbi:MAG TPA: TonB-dependent receptor [Candidatus Deferrimicrobiaceae bacterium]|jgi:vitamin B12 transporter